MEMDKKKANTNNDGPPTYDVVILGVGPAGLQAAIHAARKRARVLVLGRPESSSLFKAHIENYCCVPGIKTGEELLAVGLQQARGFGADILFEDVVVTQALSGGLYGVTTESQKTFSAYALVFATGISRKRLGLTGEKELMGKGVSYCVDCDANFYRDAVVAVVGDGSAAAHGACTLAKIAREVTLITKGLEVDQALRFELESSKVSMIYGASIKELRGTDRLEGIILDDGTEIPLDGLFIEKGAKGAMELAAFLGVTLDTEKLTYILTDRHQATNLPEIFAAGDICGPPWQMAKAVGEGCVAGLSAGTFALKKRRSQTQPS
jgi:thioredoxin reductase (NADPH)